MSQSMEKEIVRFNSMLNKAKTLHWVKSKYDSLKEARNSKWDVLREANKLILRKRDSKHCQRRVQNIEY